MSQAEDSKKVARYQKMAETYDIINFKGRTLIKQHASPYYVPMTSDEFAKCAYALYPGLLIGQIRELEHKFRAQAPDHTEFAHLVGMGPNAWDTKKLALIPATGKEVFRATLTPSALTDSTYQRTRAWKYMLELSEGDPELAWDMLQGLAPLFMHKKPTGVIWFIGEGANGKSALMNAMYRIIGHHLCSMTVAAIEDGRDSPRLNGTLGNICRESSEGKVEDSEKYKALGTHEPFETHKFHSQDTITITGDLHHVFNANNIPIFNDKTMGARRRTLVIPFPARFEDNPTFEDETFTPKFLADLLALTLMATHIIRDNHYKYRFGAATLEAKSQYDAEVNSAEAYLNHLRANKVKAYSSYRMLMMSYQAWCANEGFVPLGVTNLKRVMNTKGMVERRRVRLETGSYDNWYFLDADSEKKWTPKQLVSLDNGLHVDVLSSKSATELEIDENDEVKQQTLLKKGW